MFTLVVSYEFHSNDKSVQVISDAIIDGLFLYIFSTFGYYKNEK